MESVVGLEYPAEEDCDNARGLSNLCDQVAGVGEQEEDACLKQAEISDPGELGNEGGDDPDRGPDGEAAQEDGEEVEDRPEESSDLERVWLTIDNKSGVVFERSAENDGNSVVEQTLAEDEAVHQRVDMEVLEYGEDGDGVGG